MNSTTGTAHNARDLYGLPEIEYMREVYKDRDWGEYTGFIVPRRIYAQGNPPAAAT